MMHRNALITTASAIALALLLAGSTLAAGGAPRVATLSGANEVPPADPNGSGSAAISLNVGQATVCWNYTVSDIGMPITGAHIHVGAAGANGAVVVPLRPGNSGPWPFSGCRENVSPALIQAIIDTPQNYYVNVHNDEFPGGAIRGQLSNRGQGK